MNRNKILHSPKVRGRPFLSKRVTSAANHNYVPTPPPARPDRRHHRRDQWQEGESYTRFCVSSLTLLQRMQSNHSSSRIPPRSVREVMRIGFVNIEQREVLTIVEGEIPAAETLDLSEKMRGATAGRAVWNTYFKLWRVVRPTNMLPVLVEQIRKRKGLSRSSRQRPQSSSTTSSLLVLIRSKEGTEFVFGRRKSSSPTLLRASEGKRACLTLSD